MIRILSRIVLAALALLVATQAQAHPHVWVTMKSELVYGPDGTVTGVRHAWSFDEMFSTFATQGLAQKTKGEFTREELAPLAEVNVTSLKEFDYFTFARANGKGADFLPPKDYYLDFTNGILTLHFTLPFKTPTKTQALDIEVYDSTYMVDFAMAEKEPVKLVDAPSACQLTVARPGEASPQQKRLGEAFFEQNPNFGAQFANKISVKCP